MKMLIITASTHLLEVLANTIKERKERRCIRSEGQGQREKLSLFADNMIVCIKKFSTGKLLKLIEKLSKEV